MLWSLIGKGPKWWKVKSCEANLQRGCQRLWDMAKHPEHQLLQRGLHQAETMVPQSDACTAETTVWYELIVHNSVIFQSSDMPDFWCNADSPFQKEVILQKQSLYFLIPMICDIFWSVHWALHSSTHIQEHVKVMYNFTVRKSCTNAPNEVHRQNNANGTCES